MKQTAVEWLIQEIEQLITISTFQKWVDLKEKAKAMEKEQQEKSEKPINLEITDIEISKKAQKHGVEEHSFFTEATQNQKRLSFFAGAKWYREQLKARQ